MNLFRQLFNAMTAEIAEGYRQLKAGVSEAEKRSLKNRAGMSDAAATKALPPELRPRPRILFVDDLDLLSRNWEWTGTGGFYASVGPSNIVQSLVGAGREMEFIVVVAGESLGRNDSLNFGASMILGPSTLAERESFLISDDVADDPGPWAGLFEASPGEEATTVKLVRG